MPLDLFLTLEKSNKKGKPIIEKFPLIFPINLCFLNQNFSTRCDDDSRQFDNDARPLLQTSTRSRRNVFLREHRNRDCIRFSRNLDSAKVMLKFISFRYFPYVS